MKTNVIAVVLAFMALYLGSCSKSEVSPDDDQNGNSNNTIISGSMKATIDGKAWEAKEIGFGGALGLIQVNGSIDDQNIISLEFDETKLKLNNTYQLNTEASKNELQSVLVIYKGNILFANSGTLKISKYTKAKTIEGEINAMLWDGINPEIKLENCKFSMSYK